MVNTECYRASHSIDTTRMAGRSVTEAGRHLSREDPGERLGLQPHARAEDVPGLGQGVSNLPKLGGELPGSNARISARTQLSQLIQG